MDGPAWLSRMPDHLNLSEAAEESTLILTHDKLCIARIIMQNVQILWGAGLVLPPKNLTAFS